MESMSMSGMAMSGGMDQASDDMFRGRNQILARGLWYIIAGIVGFTLLLRSFEHYELLSRFRAARSRSVQYPTKTQGILSKAFATSVAIGREISYPQVYIKQRGLRWLSPPSSGRIIVLLCYWAIIMYMLISDAVKHDAYYYERIGFRAAWISVTQVPLVYLLASKSSIVGFLVGSSHERLNWLHRWVSRTLLVTATVHGGFFMREWVRADFVKLELEVLPMVKYGLGAWAILVWTFLSSLSPIRRLAYQVFVLQHLAAAAVFLWLLHTHVPGYAQYNIWFAVALFSFDWIVKIVVLCYRNFRVRIGAACKGMRRIGHTAQLQTVCSDITVITIRDVPMSWKPGQHLYLWLPQLGPLEAHPFTIASPYISLNKCPCDEIQFAVRAQSGFSRRIQRYAEKQQRGGKIASLTAFVAGPMGAPPCWNAYETLILISASTGASFTLPILESVLSSTSTVCIRRIKFLLAVKKRSHCAFYVQRLSTALERARSQRIDLDVEIAITGLYADEEVSLEGDKTGSLSERSSESSINQKTEEDLTVVEEKSATPPSSTSLDGGCCSGIQSDHQRSTSSTCCTQPHAQNLVERTCCTGSKNCCQNKTPAARMLEQPAPRRIVYSQGRPNIRKFIQHPVELTGGETMVVACGGKELVATVRNSVAKISDERAIHKGSGAQGIALHVEEYCF